MKAGGVGCMERVRSRMRQPDRMVCSWREQILNFGFQFEFRRVAAPVLLTTPEISQGADAAGCIRKSGYAKGLKLCKLSDMEMVSSSARAGCRKNSTLTGQLDQRPFAGL